jgi:hypothetical protein
VYRRKIPSDNLLFGLFADDSALVDEFADQVPSRYGHVPSALAYARFYLRGDDILVNEIQSEVWGSLATRRLREHYKRWGTLLLLLLEQAIVTMYGKQTRFLIVPPEYIKLRWQKIAPTVVNRIYSDLPGSLGYETHASPAYAIEPRAAPITIETASMLSSSQRDSGDHVSLRLYLASVTEVAFRDPFAEGPP